MEISCFCPKTNEQKNQKQMKEQKGKDSEKTPIFRFKHSTSFLLLMQQPYLQFWFRKRINFGSRKHILPSTAETKRRKFSHSLVHYRAPGAKLDSAVLTDVHLTLTFQSTVIFESVARV